MSEIAGEVRRAPENQCKCGARAVTTSNGEPSCRVCARSEKGVGVASHTCRVEGSRSGLGADVFIGDKLVWENLGFGIARDMAAAWNAELQRQGDRHGVS